MSGLITGNGNGDWGRVTVRTDGSILLERVSLSDIDIRVWSNNSNGLK